MKEYISLNRHLRAMRDRIVDAHGADAYAESCINDYVKRDLKELRLLWPEALENDHLDQLEIHLSEKETDWWSVRKTVVEIEDQLDSFYIKQPSSDIRTALRELLEPSIEGASYAHYQAGHYREAVLNSVMAVFDLLRQRSGLDLDGQALVTQALSIDNPILKLADLGSQSGRNIQVGFIDMLKGAYTGVRNPKAHQLETDLNAVSTAQYLVFASLLARKVSTAESEA